MTKEEKKDALEYFQGDEIAADVFLSKYALRDNNGNLLENTPKDTHSRLAKELARIENKYPNPISEGEWFYLLDKFKYLVLQGSPMSAIGNDYKIQSISNCFVIDSPYDSYGGICLTDQEQAQIMKRRGGVGFDISTIRPKGMNTQNAAGTTDGIGVFMERFSNTTREVAQNGRRGALMLTCDIRHPEIETFITIKKDLKKITGANISIRISDAFMNAVKNDTDFTLQFPIDAKKPIITKQVRAKDIWDKIIDSAWSSAEPGMLFWDTITRNTPADFYEEFKSLSTNPCSELNMCAYDSCRLALLNVLSYVENPFTDKSKFDYTLFSKHIILAQRAMDDMVDLELEKIDKILEKIENDPEPEIVKRTERELWNKIKNITSRGRRTGLGLTGVGDALASLNIQYASKQGIETVEEIYKCLAINSNISSIILAEERGCFPAFSKEMEKHSFIDKLLGISGEPWRKRFIKSGRRNICLTTTAPAGSVSVLTQTTSGIEPAFLLSYKRRRKINPNDIDSSVDFIDGLGDKWTEYMIYHHNYKKWMEITGKKNQEESPYHLSTSNDIDWKLSVDIQSAAQKWVEHSISKTCNLPKDTTKETVSEVYMRAWESGCKGFTIYRDGSRSGVLVSNEEQKKDVFSQQSAPKRPKELPCEIHSVNVKGEKWTIFVGLLEDKPYEVFGGLSKFVEIPKSYMKGKVVKHPRITTNSVYDFISGEEENQMIIKNIAEVFENNLHSATTRLISLSLRHGASIQYVVEQLGKENNSDMSTFSKVIGRVLKKYIAEGTKSTLLKKCDNCGSSELKYQEGCITCASCGWSKCL